MRSTVDGTGAASGPAVDGLSWRPPWEPFFFRAPGRPLFGCYHAAPIGRERDTALVLCPPHGHEHVRSYRALRQIAEHVARAGYPTLRFDPYGCGDSAGSSDEVDLHQWLDDVSAAVHECRTRSRSERVVLGGVRLGASLACLAAARTRIADGLILWDPVVRGAEYLDALTGLHRARLETLPGRTPVAGRAAGVELMGFPYPGRLREQLATLDLASGPWPWTDAILVQETAGGAVGWPSRAEGPRVERCEVPGPPIWAREEDVFLAASPATLAAWRRGLAEGEA